MDRNDLGIMKTIFLKVHFAFVCEFFIFISLQNVFANLSIFLPAIHKTEEYVF